MAKTSRPRPAGKSPARRTRFLIEYKVSPIEVVLPGAFVYAESVDEARDIATTRAMQLEENLNQSGFLANVVQFDPIIRDPEASAESLRAASPSAAESSDAI